MAEPFRSVKLANDLIVNFFDESNRYFGDYHRVRIRVSVDLPFPDCRSPEVNPSAATDDALCFERFLERMGVPSTDLLDVRDSLLEDFLETATQYLENPDFPRQLLRRQLMIKKRPAFPHSG